MAARPSPNTLLNVTIDNFYFKVTTNPFEQGSCILWVKDKQLGSDFDTVGKFSRFDKRVVIEFLARYATSVGLRKVIGMRKFERKLNNLSPDIFEKINKLSASQKSQAYRHLFNLDAVVEKHDLIKKRRLMIKRFHPDAGGDHLSMVVINDAYDHLVSYINDTKNETKKVRPHM